MLKTPIAKPYSTHTFNTSISKVSHTPQWQVMKARLMNLRPTGPMLQAQQLSSQGFFAHPYQSITLYFKMKTCFPPPESISQKFVTKQQNLRKKENLHWSIGVFFHAICTCRFGCSQPGQHTGSHGDQEAEQSTSHHSLPKPAKSSTTFMSPLPSEVFQEIQISPSDF